MRYTIYNCVKCQHSEGWLGMQLYTNPKLHRIAKENYRVLSRYCDLLEREGYWENPEKVLHKTIQEELDFYVQSVLVCCAAHLQRLNKDELQFIAVTVNTDCLGVLQETEDIQTLVGRASLELKNPPILIQLCGLRDKEKDSGLTGLFFDALMNIMLALAYLNGEDGMCVISYVREYYQRVEAFLYVKLWSGALLDERYIFRKICSGELEQSAERIDMVNGDFELYKKKYLFYREPAKQVALAVGPVTKQEVTEEVKAEVPEQVTEAEMNRLDMLLQELNNLVGLSQVKQEINSLINLIKVRKLREKYGLPDMEMSYHMVFSGNPGTGKTTVARLVAEIYKELGVLSKGTLTETDRAGLVAGYVGQTALKVKEVVEKALGGVLFIDEAYTLTSSEASNDFGQEALDTLVKMMEDNRDDLIVIVAGYKDEMQHFLKANTGLVSRFNKFIDFPDYSLEELIEIFHGMAYRAGFIVDEEATAALQAYLAKLDERALMSFGNARGIRNTFEKIVVNQANRIVTYQEPTVLQLTMICKEDIVI